MIIIVILSLLFTSVYTGVVKGPLPSTTGKFFYADVLSSGEPFDNAAFHRINMLLGSDDPKQYTFALNS